MTPLPAVIRKGGFKLTKVKRVVRVAIYRQHFPSGNPEHDAYEVILPQIRNTDHIGQPVDPYEGYPAAESWGRKGWTFTKLAKAVQKLKELARNGSRVGTASRKNRLDASGEGVGGAVSPRKPHAPCFARNTPTCHRRAKLQSREAATVVTIDHETVVVRSMPSCNINATESNRV